MNDLAGFIDDSRTYTFHSRNPDRKISQISQYFKAVSDLFVSFVLHPDQFPSQSIVFVGFLSVKLIAVTANC